MDNSDWAYFSVAEKIVEVVTGGEEVSQKEISARLRSVNAGYRIYSNAINKAISIFLSEAFIPIGKNTWRVQTNDEGLKKAIQRKSI